MVLVWSPGSDGGFDLGPGFLSRSSFESGLHVYWSEIWFGDLQAWSWSVLVLRHDLGFEDLGTC